MTATDHLSSRATTAPTPPQHRRWGLDIAHTPHTPEPIDWQPPPTVWQRLRRAASVPIAAAAVVFIAVVLISVTTVWLRPHAVDDTAAPEAAHLAFSEMSDAADGGSAGVPGLADDASELSEALPLFVHVVGEVHEPGVYELPPGSRVAAAIEAAGGATPSAVLAGVNLARVLVDGEQVQVPDQQQVIDGPLDASSAVSSPGGASALVNLNTADAAALETLPRVGPALAQRIIDWRTAHGGFDSVDHLMNVSGIGQKTFDQLRELVTV